MPRNRMTAQDTTPTTGKILLIGAFGQIGSELADALAERYGNDRVVLADLHPQAHRLQVEQCNVVDKERLEEIIRTHDVKVIYHLAALLSATGEQNPALAWQVNMQGLLNVLELSLAYNVERVFWPSSIAVFGPHSPQERTPQFCTMDPSTIYGITKQAGERLCAWYFEQHGLDIRSLRYPGLISYKTPPGGGTTDYAVEVFYDALAGKAFSCFLKPDTALPMMYMPDAIRGTMELMAAPAEQISIRDSYNIGALSFTPAELFAEIAQALEGFSYGYQPDFRQQIAESWPRSIDDSTARRDWGWQPEYDLAAMTQDMLRNVQVPAAGSVQ